MEATADMLNHLPMVLADTSKTSSRIRDNFEGMVYDMCTERANDGEEYDVIAPRGSLKDYIKRGCKLG